MHKYYFYRLLRLFHIISKDEYKKKTAKYTREYKTIARSKLFDAEWYLEHNPDVKEAGLDPIEHYLNFGWKEGREGSLYFDGKQYLKAYPDVKKANINPLVHWELKGKKENRRAFINKNIKNVKIKFPRKTRSFVWESECINDKVKRLAVFASFASDGKIADYVVYYLRNLKEVCDAILFVTDNPLYPKEFDKIKDFVDYAKISRHGEADFGSYKRGYLYAHEKGLLDTAEELIFCNDSCCGPFYAFENMFTKMEKQNFDCWGVCANDQVRYHLQSYFLVFKKKVFSSELFLNFMKTIKQKYELQPNILDYELDLMKMLEDSKFKCGSYISYEPNDKEYPYMFSHDLNSFPLFLLRHYSPLLKTKIITDVYRNLDGVKRTLEYVKELSFDVYNFLPKEDDSEHISFSVIMPTYNRKRFIGKAVQSVLEQTYQNFELIIVDDGSSDGTDEYINNCYKKEIERGKIKYFYKSNAGVCKARNYGLERASNEWIAYCDSDNAMFPNFLEAFKTSILANTKKKCFYAQFQRMSTLCCVGSPFDYSKLMIGNYIDLGVFVHHCSIYKKLGGFDENMTRLVDWDLILRYTKKYSPIYLDCPLLLYNDIDDHARITNNVNYAKNLAYLQSKLKGQNLIKITTMITTYNHEKYIRQAIESAVQQRGNFIHEILISDDASTDSTPQIIQEYAQRYPYLIRDISSKKNLGISGNMKKCFREATGKYIAVLEGDDYWTDFHKLEKQMLFLERNKDCSMVFSKLQLHDEMSNTFSYLDRQSWLPKKLSCKYILKDPTTNLVVNFSCCMFKSEYMKNLPDILYTERLSEIALSFYLEQKGKLGFISTPLSVYRVHEKGTWSGSELQEKLESGLICRQTALAVCAEKYKARLQEIIDVKYVKPLEELKKSA